MSAEAAALPAGDRLLSVAAILLVLAFIGSGLVQAWRDSPTVDEAVDIASGITSIVRHDLRLEPEHDLLVHVLPPIPALFAHPIIPDGVGYRTDDWFGHADEFLRANRAAHKLRLIVFLARLVPLLEGVAVGWLLAGLGTSLFGRRAGLLAASLWFSTPVFVGFSHLVSIDVTFTLCVLLVCGALVRYRTRPAVSSLAGIGAALGVALLGRHSAVLLAPAVCVSIGFAHAGRPRREVLKHLVGACLMGWAIVWIVMVGFGSSPNPLAASHFDGLIAAGRSYSLLSRMALAVPWPKEWSAGLAYLAITSSARPAYLLGHAWVGNRWWFFPGSLLVKVPGAVLVLIAVIPLSIRRWSRDTRRVIGTTLLPVIVVLGGQLLVQKLDLGLRYAFPVVALVLVLASALPSELGPRMWLGIVGVLTLSQTALLVESFPHSLAWSPPPFSQGYRSASDSNIDYGQDADAVDHWAAGKSPSVALLLPRGTDPPAGSQPLLRMSPAAVTGWVAVSVTRLTVLDHDALSWLRAYCPVTTVGGSILIYRFMEAPDAKPGPETPAGVCRGGNSTRRR
ncbi:MAG: hypothetical protein NVS3B21_00920 [Acidimicrobiales bacterium]